jgi:primosomal protein N'
MNVLVQHFVGRRSEADCYVECRYCGTTLSSTTTPCPDCGSERTATYEIE